MNIMHKVQLEPGDMVYLKNLESNARINFNYGCTVVYVDYDQLIVVDIHGVKHIITVREVYYPFKYVDNPSIL